MADMSTDNEIKKKPELMSPAGHWPQLKAAVACGADAVYFGLNHFTARAKVGFGLEELPQVFEYLHRFAVKGFVTFNTLVFDHEIEQAEEAIAGIANSGADAIIVQDVGVAKLAKRMAPELEVHGSTQMSITSAEGAELAASLGCNRVVLGRELSLADIRKIKNATDVELEVFVHGALCVSYSGQCFSSEAWGGRSANRGQCAQACRLSYDLMVDGKKRELGEYRYLLSPGDLYALEQIPELIDIGVDCFKIEGRYKNSEYVSLTTKAYRDAIDQVFDKDTCSQVDQNELTQIYSRGLGPHFVAGVNHQTVVQGRVPRHRGLQVGAILEVRKRSVVVELEHELKPGDGVVFDSSAWRSPDEPEEGGNIFVVEKNGQKTELEFGRGEVDFDRIRVGDRIFRTNDPQLNKKARQLTRTLNPTTGIRFEAVAEINQPLRVIARTALGEVAQFKSEELLLAAKSRAINQEMLEAQLGRLGGTPFHMDSVDLEMNQPLFCPVSLLNDARRNVVEQLLDARKPKPIAVSGQCEPDLSARTDSISDNELTQMHVLVRTPEQLDAAIECKPDSITLDYLELYGLRPSVEKMVQAGIQARVASPRILKPSEQKIVNFLLSLNCDLLVRSGGLLRGLQIKQPLEVQLHGDFSLNAANGLSMDTYLQMGLSRITPTYDLNAAQITELARSFSPDAMEVVVFHHLPVFHTEHCVFCRFLSNGTDHTNCGHPCEKHRIAIKDVRGREHAVMADVGCRNTVFGAQAQTAVNHLDRWLDAGLRHFRIEFVHQDAKQVPEILFPFRKYLDRQIDSKQLGQLWERHSEQGTTEGSLFVPKDYKQLIQLGVKN